MTLGNFLRKIKPMPAARNLHPGNHIYAVKEFRRLLERECARADRVGLHFALINFDLGASKNNGASSGHLINLLSRRMRTTDELGWLDDLHIGLLLFDTGLGAACRFANTIRATISPLVKFLDYNVYVYPADNQDLEKRNGQKRKNRTKTLAGGASHRQKTLNKWVRTTIRSPGRSNPQLSLNTTLQSCLKAMRDIKPLILSGIPIWKRSMDIAGALFGLIILFPVFLLVAATIKSVSSGPVFFKQQRIGYGGMLFKLWKFRTMKVNAEARHHQQYLAGLIKCGSNGEKTCLPMEKLDNEPQIIPFGNLLRQTYIDELPQLINVLIGEMSLVGPRPPIPYEVEVYMRWHKGRFDTVPGMTGLWQVSGKNRLTFKEMVRLDIRYSKNLSFFSDVKILAMTPIAIISEIKYTH